MTRTSPRFRSQLPRKVGALVVAVGLTMSLSFAMGGAAEAAKPPPVTGTAQCTLSGGVLTFEPGLRYKDHITGIQKGRGPSNGALTANLIGCTDAALGPAPGGIDHGTLQAGTHVAGSYRNLSSGIKIRRLRIDWFTADNAVVGRSWMKMVMSITPGFDFYALATVSSTASTLMRSTVFPTRQLVVHARDAATNLVDQRQLLQSRADDAWAGRRLDHDRSTCTLRPTW